MTQQVLEPSAPTSKRQWVLDRSAALLWFSMAMSLLAAVFSMHAPLRSLALQLSTAFGSGFAAMEIGERATNRNTPLVARLLVYGSFVAAVVVLGADLIRASH